MVSREPKLRNGWRDFVIAVLAGALLSAGGIWAAWGRDVVSRSELDARLAPQHEVIAELKEQVHELSVQLQRQAELLAKLQALVDRMERGRVQ